VETEQQISNEVSLPSIWAGGLLAAGLVILQSFLPLDLKDLDSASLISVGALALAMPTLSYQIVVNILRARKYHAGTRLPYRQRRTHGFETFLFFIGALSVLVGIAAAFYHIHWIMSVIFLLSVVVVIVAYFTYHRA
jgi:hypothetical protein